MTAEGRSAAIGIAEDSESSEIRQFLREHWSADHVFVRHPELFQWQHHDVASHRCNFVVGRGSTGRIDGVLGFIPLSRYDGSLSGPGRETVWLTTWKVSASGRGLGLGLLAYLQKAFPDAWIGTVGLNASTLPIYRGLRYETGRLTRFCLINPDCERFDLARLPQGFVPPVPVDGATTIRELPLDSFWSATDGLQLDSGDLVPLKSRGYVYSRYLQHPYYRYQVYLASLDRHSGLIVTRICTHGTSRALRVVDFVGTPSVLAGIGPALLDLLTSVEAEYLDFYAAGLDPELSTSGLYDADLEGLILPGYFEPLVVKNVDLLYSLRGPAGRRALFKGDADQDRPNALGDVAR